MENNYILGAGPAGLIAAYFFEDHKIIDKKPLGQLNLPFIPGPRLIQATDNMKALVKELFPDNQIHLEIAKIGFNINNKIEESPTIEFRKNYALKTRGVEKSESSFLSEGMVEIPHIEIDTWGENSYKILFERLLGIIKKRGQLIETTVKSINPFDKVIKFDNDIEGDYTHIISTLNLNLFKKLDIAAEDMPHDLTTLPKCFYQTEYQKDSWENHPSLFFDYVYSADTDWTRQTFFRDYIVYESVEPIKGDTIEGNKIINKFENLPIQIKESLRIGTIDGIEMLGRFAEWDHQVKANEVLDKVIYWKDRYYG